MRHGSLFSGYGGLDMAVEQTMGARTVWVSDVDKGACKVLAHRYPDVPNLGDVTAVDWSTVEPVDVISGGSPCQDLSHAGKRGGMTAGTRSNLWVAMREAIAQLRPTYVIWENVRGAYSAAADSDVEPCPGCVGDGSGVHLRALGRVLGDLSSLGYLGGWHGLRAADVGAPHGRFRVFVVARLASTEPAYIGHERTRGARHGGPGPADGDRGAVALLPTPRATAVRQPDRWGRYADAIARWEHFLGRPAPEPTEPTGRNGAPRLSAAFDEWLMGLPAGWITDAPGITRNEALKLCGNGVVPQQAADAITYLIDVLERIPS